MYSAVTSASSLSVRRFETRGHSNRSTAFWLGASPYHFAAVEVSPHEKNFVPTRCFRASLALPIYQALRIINDLNLNQSTVNCVCSVQSSHPGVLLVRADELFCSPTVVALVTSIAVLHSAVMASLPLIALTPSTTLRLQRLLHKRCHVLAPSHGRHLSLSLLLLSE